jgi:hypothetical protein
LGNEYGDAQNTAIRVFLKQFSKKFNTFFSDDLKQKTLEYFNYKCPYSGDDISDGKFVMDHIVSFNRECCGLHIYGNILLVTKEANNAKHHQPVEDFLKNEPAKLARIQKFMKDSGYTDIHERYNKQLKLNCKSLYEKVRELIEGDFNDFVSVIQIHNNRSYSGQINQLFSQNNQGNMQQTALSAKLSSTSSTPDPQTKTSFKLLKTDKNNNKYFTFPEDEVEFKRKAYQNGGIFVKVIHPDGHIEPIVRRVNKMWSKSVYWNINSMPTKYASLNRLSKAHNLVVYACPISYKDSIT